MNKQIKSAIFFFMVGTAMIGCQKGDDAQTPETKTEATYDLDNSDEPMSYNIAKEDFEEELTVLLDESFNADFLEDYPNATLSIVASSDVSYSLTITPNPDGDPQPLYQVVCSGTGYSFVLCCKNWFDAHPDDCLTISYSSESEAYSADDDCDEEE